MDYKKYCKLNKINPADKSSKKMYWFYLEAEAASTDFNIKEEYVIQTTYHVNDFYAECISLAPLNSTSQVAVCNSPCPVPCAKAKGNNPMYIDNDKHIESGKLNYFNDRVSNITCRKGHELSSTFHLNDDAQPQSPSELVKRIQDGKFVLSKETEDKKVYDPVRFIKWRDPAVLADKDGYDAAVKSLGAASTKASDAVMSGADPLAAIQTLDAWTPTVGTA